MLQSLVVSKVMVVCVDVRGIGLQSSSRSS